MKNNGEVATSEDSWFKGAKPESSSQPVVSIQRSSALTLGNWEPGVLDSYLSIAFKLPPFFHGRKVKHMGFPGGLPLKQLTKPKPTWFEQDCFTCMLADRVLGVLP